MKQEEFIINAEQLANDIDEYAPDTNIAWTIRKLILEYTLLKEKYELTKEKK